ncbi:uncharacterized protein HD556DRAFT_1461110, partial [Suillus plorans]
IVKYLKYFRADNIEAETIRHFLFDGKKDLEARKWTIFGQIFGVRATTYISFYSDSLTEVFIAGGIPPMVDSPDAAYEALVLKVEEQNKVYYSNYARCSKHKKSREVYLHQVVDQLPGSSNLGFPRRQQCRYSKRREFDGLTVATTRPAIWFA